MDLNFWKKDDSREQVDNSEVKYQYTAEPEASTSEVVESPEYYPVEPPDPEKAKFYNNISQWALYIGIFLMPLFFLPWTSNPLELNKQILLIVGQQRRFKK